MKKSKVRSTSWQRWLLLPLFVFLIISQQNCSPGFKGTESQTITLPSTTGNSSTSTGGTNNPPTSNPPASGGGGSNPPSGGGGGSSPPPSGGGGSPPPTGGGTNPPPPPVLTPAEVACSAPGAPPAASSCVGVAINSTWSTAAIQSAIDSQPTGTSFCFAPGTYVLNTYLQLKSGNKLICTSRRNCILTGQDQYRGAVTAVYGTTGQLVKGFVIERFIAVSGVWPVAGLQLRDAGVMEDNEIRNCQTGIEMNAGATARGNWIHHNRQYGISGGPGDNITIENNDISFNNTDHLDPSNDAGGSKIVGSSAGAKNLIWRGNHIHSNFGQGLWSDGNVLEAVYENNCIENNTGIGIDHEISYSAIIRNNLIRNNLTAEVGLGHSCWHGGQIHVNNSQGVEIYGNTIESTNINALCLANTTRSEPAVFPQFLGQIQVRNNTFVLKGSAGLGVVGDSTPTGISFTQNTYRLDNLNGTFWQLMTGPFNSTQWKAKGQDVTGQFLSP